MTAAISSVQRNNDSTAKALAIVGNIALNTLTFPVTTTVAEGTACTMKSLVTPDCGSMSHDTDWIFTCNGQWLVNWFTKTYSI